MRKNSRIYPGRNLDLNAERNLNWDAIFLAKIAVWFLWIALSATVILFTKHGLVFLLGMISIGLAFAHGVELQHQALHQTGFRNRRANRIAGFFLGAPMLVSYSAYQDSHLYHHKYLGTDADTEFFDYGGDRDISVKSLAIHFVIVKHYLGFLKHSFASFRPEPIPTLLLPNSKAIRAEYCLMATAILAICFVAIFLHSYFFLYVWALPLLLVSGPVHALIELPEHFGCKKSLDVRESTRSISTNRLAAWFTNGNCYHVEHHQIASLPIELLRNVHHTQRESYPFLSPSYTSFYRLFLREIRENFESANDRVNS